MNLRLTHAAVPASLALGLILIGGAWRSQAAAQAGDIAPTSSVQHAPPGASSRPSPPVRAMARPTRPANGEPTATPVVDPQHEPGTTKPRDIAASVRAGKMAGAWTDVRKVLVASPDPEDHALAEEVYALVLELRKQRRAPDPGTWRDLEDEMDDLAELVEARGHATAEALERAHALRDR